MKYNILFFTLLSISTAFFAGPIEVKNKENPKVVKNQTIATTLAHQVAQTNVCPPVAYMCCTGAIIRNYSEQEQEQDDSYRNCP